MFHKFILYIIGVCLFPATSSSQCFIWSLSATASNCLAGSNLGSYEVTGTIVTLFAPSSGTLTISSNNGTSVTLSAPFSLSMDYTLPTIAGHGNNYTVTASYSADASCTKQKSHSTQTCCTVTPTNTTRSVCQSQTLSLAATSTTGGNYFWSGPSGFSSTQQNPTIPNIPTSKAGLYQVYLVNGSCTTPTQSVNVTVTPKPPPKSIVTQ
jgi:hypothetical protein